MQHPVFFLDETPPLVAELFNVKAGRDHRFQSGAACDAVA